MVSISPSVLLEDTVEFPPLVDAYRYVRHVWILALTLCLYDYVLTLKREFKFFWRGPFSISKSIFLMNRYYAIIYLLSGNLVMALMPTSKTTLCKVWFNVYTNGIIPMFITFFLISLGRLHAAFNCDRCALIAMSVFFGSELIVISSLQGYFASRFKVVALPPTWTGCIPMNTVAYSWALLILLGVAQGALILALVMKTLQTIRQGFRPPRALVIILRDTALYTIFTCAGIVFDTLQPGGMQSTLIVWPPLLVALLSTMGSRMLLNIHQVLDEAGDERGTLFTTVQMHSLQFAEAPTSPFGNNLFLD